MVPYLCASCSYEFIILGLGLGLVWYPKRCHLHINQPRQNKAFQMFQSIAGKLTNLKFGNTHMGICLVLHCIALFEYAVFMSFTKYVTVKPAICVNIHITYEIIVLLKKPKICDLYVIHI